MGIQARFHGGKSGFQGTDTSLVAAKLLAIEMVTRVTAAGFVEGIADALVGAGLPVHAVGVDLEQDGDIVAGAVRDFGGGDPALSRSDTAAWRRP
jgi:hypothetical protein